MTGQAHDPVIAVLRRAALFVAVLALMAGIFGMHVFTATHAMHSPGMAGATVSAHDQSPPASHTEDHIPRQVSASAIHASPGDESTHTAQCTESGTCTSMQAMTGSCTPAAKTGCLAAPLPGTGIIGGDTDAGTLATIAAQWSYVPGSPSPGELCTSRT